jgi:flagellar hook-associated protein 2
MPLVRRKRAKKFQEETLGLAFGSINTGLPKDIVQQIMKAERIPVKNMETRKGKFEDKKGLVGELIQIVEGLKGSLLQNGNARSLRELSIDTNESIIGVTADKNIAEPASYQLEVKQLAQKSSAMSSGFEDPDDSYVGVGFIQYTLPNGDNKEIYVDSDNSSLKKIAKLINKDSESGLRASVVNDGSQSETPWRLILSLKETGDVNKAEFPYFYFVDGEDDLYLEFEREAQDAVVALDGFDIELGENKSSELIPGLTIDLKKAKPGEEFAINITEDTQAVGEKVSAVVDQINAVFAFIKQQNTLDETSDTSRTLGGDIMLQSLEGRLRSAVFKNIETKKGNFRVGDIGITFTREGNLKFDQEKFSSELKKDYQNIAEILTGTFKENGTKSDGFIDNMSNVVNQSLRFPDGLLASRKRSLENNISAVDRRIKQKEKMLEQKEKNLKDKFARLEGTISRIKAQGAGIQGMGGAAPQIAQLG